MKRFLSILLAVAALCGCAASDPSPVTQSEPISVSQPPSASEAESQPLSEREKAPPKVELQFEKPTRKYNIIAELPTDGGYAIVYEAQMDDEFNRRFSRDSVFWGLYAQLFDADGKLVSTFDYDRHNVYSIPTPVSRLSCDDGVIYFESRHILDNLEQPYEMDYCFYLSTNDDRYRMKSYYVVADKGGVSFQIGSEYDEKEGIDRTVLRLVGEEYGESRIVMEYIDPSINSGLYRLVYNYTEDELNGNSDNAKAEKLYDVTVEMNTGNSQVTVKNAKVRLALDFAKGVAEESYQYSDDMLDKPVAKSSDGKSEVWAADVRDYFESASGCDYVVKNESGIYRLCPGNDVYNVVFVGNDKILLNAFGALEMYNAADGSLCEQQPQFDYGDIPNPYSNDGARGVERVTVGIAYDSVNDVILIAHRQNTFGSHGWTDKNGKENYEFPVALTVLNGDGKWLRDIETGFEMIPFGKFVVYSVDISCDDGVATLKVRNRNELSAEVKYLL